jgi:hypothetical protein
MHVHLYAPTRPRESSSSTKKITIWLTRSAPAVIFALVADGMLPFSKQEKKSTQICQCQIVWGRLHEETPTTSICISRSTSSSSPSCDNWGRWYLGAWRLVFSCSAKFRGDVIDRVYTEAEHSNIEETRCIRVRPPLSLKVKTYFFLCLSTSKNAYVYYDTYYFSHLHKHNASKNITSLYICKNLLLT